MSGRQILIVSSFFAPESTPRAFRVTALVREFARRGDYVTLLLPNKQIYHDNPIKIDGVEVIFGRGPLLSTNATLRPRKRVSILPPWARKLILYLISHEFFMKYDKGVERALMSLKGHFDLILSVSYPVAIHRAVAYALRHNKELSGEVTAAEFSDPPFRTEHSQGIFALYKMVMRNWAKRFDYFITPTKIAIECYTPYISEQRVKIIPQGFELDMPLKPYSPNVVPTFAYAGRFYENIRDPRFLFDWLCTLECDYRFMLYVNLDDEKFDNMINHYSALSGGRIVRCGTLPREELLSELATMDFLVNLEYTTKNASPIKLIDYGIAGRPIISFRQENFDSARFEQFMEGVYDGRVEIDMSDYDIHKVAAQFEELLPLKKR